MKKKVKGFTLVELLVVISIIAMLLAVLIPALAKARQSAYSVVCRSHMRQYGIAMTTYITEWNDFFAGPNTSGIELNNNPRFSKLPLESSPTSPLLNIDWVSPTLGKALALPKNRYQRLTRILNTDLRCATNNQKYDYVYDEDGESISVSEWSKLHNLGIDILRYSSYSATLGFHVYDADVIRGRYIDPPIITTYGAAIDDKVELPRGYSPKMQKIGKPSEKIYVIDGARYIDTAKGASFNELTKQIAGGNFMLYGPATPESCDPFAGALKGVGSRRALSPTVINYKYGWRHSKGSNAVFFDGHCKTLKALDSLKISYYFPKGTKVVNAELTQDLSDTTGMIIN